MTEVSYLIPYETLLQNTTDIITKCDSYFITKCDRSLLQNATVFLKIARIFLQNATVFTNCDSADTDTSNGIYNKLYSKLLHAFNKHAPMKEKFNK